jgi:cell division protein FtsL
MMIMATHKRRKLKLLKGEKVLYSTAIILSLLFLVFTVFSKATISEMNIKVERLKGEVATQIKKNESLTMKVNELGSLDNINLVVNEMGLSYNNSNIKNITD